MNLRAAGGMGAATDGQSGHLLSPLKCGNAYLLHEMHILWLYGTHFSLYQRRFLTLKYSNTFEGGAPPRTPLHGELTILS